MTCHRTSPAAEHSGFLAELEGLVRVAARRPHLHLIQGAPGSGWSFNWRLDRVTVDPDDIRRLAPDLCRGLTLHEAAHAAITVVHQVLPRPQLSRWLPLFNTVEDIRIEVWMQRQFPGAAAWIDAYNRVFYGSDDTTCLSASRQVQFQQGLLHHWWFGSLLPGTLPEVASAVAECQHPLAEAVACLPPLVADADQILTSQRSMWEIVERQIVPVWERLVDQDEAAGIPRLESSPQELAEAEALRPLGDTLEEASLEAAAAVISRRFAAVADDPSAEADSQQLCARISAALAASGDNAYQTARRAIAGLIDRVGDELLRLLLPQQRLQWQTGLPSGPRLDLRRALRFEADPQAYRSLWSRPRLPRRREPAVLLLIDRSGSMKRPGLIDRTFEAVVLLAEVCHRIGVPVAVWSFAGDCRRELSWNQPLSLQIQQTLSRLPAACGGTTRMAEAIEQAGDALRRRVADPRLLFVLSDGEPDEPAEAAAAVDRLMQLGIDTIGLGLGPRTAGLARFFPQAATEIAPADLPACLGRLITDSLVVR